MTGAKVDPVTARYADALFGLAKKQAALPTVEADMQRLAREVSVPAVEGFLFSPSVAREDKLASLSSLIQGFHSLTRNLLELLFDKRREEVLRGLALAFHKRALEERGQVEGVVESARALDPAELASLASALGVRLGKEVLLRARLAPETVGGVRVFVGNQMIDYSVQGRMGGLRKRLLEARLSGA